jgi:hypothetical protein
MKWIVTGVAAMMIFTLSACEKKEAETAATSEPATQTETTTQQAAPGGGHAPAGVVPGSYEDWCTEHAVPETQCTRCNPELIAAFKATNDWCAEHGLPESQCLACNPDLKIVRPAKPAESTEPKTEG